MTDVKATISTTVELVIGGKKHVMTLSEAKALRDMLTKEIGDEIVYAPPTPRYPPVIDDGRGTGTGTPYYTHPTITWC